MSSPASTFRCIQFEFGFDLGPSDGRYLVRAAGAEEAQQILCIESVDGARGPGRRGHRITDAAAPVVACRRVTVIDARPAPTPEHARTWLAALRADEPRRDRELAAAFAAIGRAVRADRLARADPARHDVSAADAIAVRFGFGEGESVAAGRFTEAWEPPRARPRLRRAVDSSQERIAALLGGRDTAAPCEDLTLRARADLSAGNVREAALQTRIALEATLAELEGRAAAGHRATLEADRALIGEAANAALDGALTETQRTAVASALDRIEAAVRASVLDRN